MAPFKSEVSAMTDPMAQLESLGGHPPVDGLYRSVKERYDWLVSTVDKKCTATQECCQMAREFEQGEGILAALYKLEGAILSTVCSLYKYIHCCIHEHVVLSTVY